MHDNIAIYQFLHIRESCLALIRVDSQYKYVSVSVGLCHVLSCHFIGQLYTTRCLLGGILGQVWKRLFAYIVISNIVVCATNKGSDQPANTRSLIRAFTRSRLKISTSVKLLTEHHFEFLIIKEGCTCSSESTLVEMPHCWKSHVTAHLYFRELLLGDRDYKDRLAQNLECPEDRIMQEGMNRLSFSREKSGILENILAGL